ncbi:hypothetical protein NHX12_024432 [Muraenolepis orangiensis]|uniref:Peptidase S1 domain-containing protein n=1 Tax=Muraenolepis orangiensis TaxID=630683 RepID=A0A9Q0EKD4_9TELE|nr:hypothetical protein NHX12_024432 [Muraenolepis orangiensis]
MDVSSYIIYTGRQTLNGFNPYMTAHRVLQVIVRPSYVESNRGADLALVELTPRVTWSDYAHPICVPDAGALFPGGLGCTVTGWGHTREHVALSGVGTLQEVGVPIISQASCQNLYNLVPEEQGDSGGPLVCPMANGTWVQAGVVSFGLGCAGENRPGVYAKVSTFSDLIRGTVPGIRLYGQAPQSRAWGPTAVLCLLFAGHFLLL